MDLDQLKEIVKKLPKTPGYATLVEIRHKNEHSNLETRPYYLSSTPGLDIITEIPEEYKNCYHTEPPFLIVRPYLDHNWTRKGDQIEIKLEDIIDLWSPIQRGY